MPKQVFIDIQFLQTDAYKRGMGRYFCELLYALLAGNTDVVYECVYTKALPDQNIQDLKQKLHEKGYEEQITFTALNLRLHNLKDSNYAAAYAHNLKSCSDFVTTRQTAAVNAVWMVPCLMQEPAIPVIPRLPRLITCVIWYDLIPYLLYDHYFHDRSSAYAQSYSSRLNILPTVDHIFSISAASKDDLVEFISIPGHRITNIRGSINQELVTAPPVGLPEQVKAPFFLCPASAEPSKNVLNTIKGFGEFNEHHQNKYQLVVTSNYDNQLAQEAHTHAKNVIFTGHISSSELQALYQNTEGLLFASMYEGLGLPILEAVHFAKKVICSEIPVFKEMDGGAAFYWCQPDEPTTVAAALNKAIVGGSTLTSQQQAVYQHIETQYNWRASAEAVTEQFVNLKPRIAHSKTIAIVGPHPSGFSTIGKVIGETYPYLAEVVNVHYYYDSGPSDIRHGQVHFHYLNAYEHLYPLDELATRLDNYDRIIYHIGNSDHHMKTYLLAKTKPSTVVLHDTNLADKGLSGQMISNGFLSLERLQLEMRVETEYLKKQQRFITSLVSSQHKTIVHSKFAATVVRDYYIGGHENTRATHLPISTRHIANKPVHSGPIQLGMAGILASIKGLDLIEWLFTETSGLDGCELSVFGFGFFADKKRLTDLQNRYPNLHVAFDLSDLKYKDLLSKMDILINYRTTYNGETSRSTLEAMRTGVVPVVRNIGWYSELPKDTCFAIDDMADLPQLLREFGEDPIRARSRLAPMIKAGQKVLREQYNFVDYVKELTDN